jgi:hypothetical protein
LKKYLRFFVTHERFYINNPITGGLPETSETGNQNETIMDRDWNNHLISNRYFSLHTNPDTAGTREQITECTE